MNVVALISGGKDSCYNMMQCVAAGHSIVALANLRPANTDELDSYMYQTVGHQAIDLYAEAMDLPLYRRTIQGSSLKVGRDYSQTEGDEVEDLYHLLKMVMEKEAVEAVSVGAILSDYQRTRVENVCARLSLQPLAYLWRRNQTTLLAEMISCGVHALLIKVAAVGLDPEKHLGKPLADMEAYLTQLSQKYGVHVCGEGGEYETLTVDCPLFKKRLVIDAMEAVIHSDDAFAPVGYLHFSKMHTEHKAMGTVALPLGGCPCQSAIDEMTEEAEYADQAEDIQDEFTSKGDLSCHKRREFLKPECDRLPVPSDVLPSWSARSLGGFQWISGIKPLSLDQGIDSQTAAAFTLLQGELKRRGWWMERIVLVHLYVRNMQDFGTVNKVYTTHFGINPPARVCVQVPLPVGQLLQIDCLLHDWPSEPQEAPEETTFHHREALHVQSLSHWAPANIGPYSQAFRVDETVFCAGQIALVPCTMQLVRGGARIQARLSFSHVEKVLEAVVGSLTLSHVLQAHCYVTRSQDIAVVRAVWDDKLKVAREKEESLGDPELQCGLLTVIVVPVLPRGAAVELHVTATHDDPRNRTSSQMTTEVAGGTVDCRAVLSSDSHCATVSLALAVPHPVPAVSGLDQEIFGAMGVTLQSVRQKWDEGGRLSPLCARVFYKCDNLLARQLVTGLEDCLRTTLGQSSPSVTFVPVLDLPDYAVLHLSCWLGL
ncbi:hypothetical protein DPEC_G00294380 [Dallia pectoralis]|uniref:Uncharacterized protein n=1 Tax=Dallia pectoralis TaxID=75939 RepID=A0ACC2FIG8_DALPE|nr:hypothetical protein DPEC_G00294380 [Dallia pectoralis]